MIFEYILAFIIIFFTVYRVIYAIKSKCYSNLITLFLVIPFMVFLFSAIYLGGSAFNSASTKYDLYQDGHYYLIDHNKYTEVTYNQFVYMKIIQVIGTVSFYISLVIAVVSSSKGKKQDKEVEIEEEWNPIVIDDEDVLEYKANRLFVSLSKQSILKFIITILVISSLLYLLIIDWTEIYIAFIFILVWLLYGAVRVSFSKLIFKKNMIQVFADDLFEIGQAQKKFEVLYSDIKSIEIIRLPLHHNTRNEEIAITSRFNKHKYSYFMHYLTYDLYCIQIKLKSNRIEGIVLNNYTKSQQNHIYNELLRRVKNEEYC